ncbi:hypothetical protein [Methylovirgula sp. 4M-Z18]|uniref:hypothetical protein n=1 Tax=Methylovirgula sp. 4M-Z18 TaxID=2293567 RepID=UPI000E2F6680|nr:hypothetical protein [Methylovirgula sp. 4M-Z18]RFB80021.1 hypothetical protein DYH55_00260 [Methylovirgula sp. 4M-Z18]
MTAPVLANVAAHVAALAQAVAAAAPLKTASLATLAPLILQAEGTLTAIDAAIAATDATIATDSVAGVETGDFPPALAATLTAQSATLQNMVTLTTLKGLVGRVLFNLQQGTG